MTSRFAPGATADVQLVLDRADRGGDLRSLRDPRRIGPAHHWRRQVHRPAAAGPEAAHARTPDTTRRPRHRRSRAAVEALLATPPFAWDLAVIARDRALNRAADRADFASAGVRSARGRNIPGSPWRRIAGRRSVRCLSSNSRPITLKIPTFRASAGRSCGFLMQPRLPAAAFVVALQKFAASGAIVLDGAFRATGSACSPAGAIRRSRVGQHRAAARRRSPLPPAPRSRYRGRDPLS